MFQPGAQLNPPQAAMYYLGAIAEVNERPRKGLFLNTDELLLLWSVCGWWLVSVATSGPSQADHRGIIGLKIGEAAGTC